ncbi:MAG: methyltransferase [Thermodesulfobacteriota bacterium]|nr:methyltransferase [Thermodesulfobacteriota bacterium]
MDREEWTREGLLGVSGNYWQSCTLHASVKLDLFTLIGDNKINAKELARGLDCDQRAVKTLLDALTAMGLLIKRQDRYANTNTGKSLLVKGSPHYIGHMVKHHHHLVEAWSRLDQAVKTGKPVNTRHINDEEERESFLMGMFNLAMGIAPYLTRQIDLSGRNHLLDLGGGPGTYAIHFCLENPALMATVYDLPLTEPFAKKTIERFGLSNRINFMPGDYLIDDVNGAYDVVWLSHILHAVGPDGCQTIIEKAVSAMLPGGFLLVHDFIMNDTFDGPVFPAVFSLNMLVNTEDGRSYSEGQIREMLESAGLRDIRRLPFQGPNESGVVCGVL